MSCEKTSDKNIKQSETEMVYRIILERAKEYNNQQILVSGDLANQPVDLNNLYRIKKGIRFYNKEIEKTIDDYNSSEQQYSLAALKKVAKTKMGYTSYMLSKIGFNELMNYAFLYEIDMINPDLSHKSYYLLKKDGNDWNIESEIIE